MRTIDPRQAWLPYRPTPENPWDARKAGHLYRRAGFGATFEELQAAREAGPQKTIDLLLSDRGDAPPFPASIARGNVGPQLPAWWLMRMRETHNPLREKLTLFWHNHFATSNAKVNNARFMIGMYDLMYHHALGNFATLLQEISRDPAMLVWLDTAASKKGMPNENYARELMELFSLGIGHYTEQDIREAARAFTGWEIRDGQAVFVPEQHDAGKKTVLGKTGAWKGEDIVRICLEQKCCAEFIVGKLFRFLISETLEPTPELIEPLARQFRSSGYDFGALVATMLRSNLFFSKEAYRSRIKSPVEFALGIVRPLQGQVPMSALAQALEGLGQRLFYPPSVKGWDGGTAWLNAQTLLFRQNLALALTSTQDDRFLRRCDPAPLVRKYDKASDEEIVRFFLTLFLQDDVSVETRTRLRSYLRDARQRPTAAYEIEDVAAQHPIRAVCHLVLSLPEFQLD